MKKKTQDTQRIEQVKISGRDAILEKVLIALCAVTLTAFFFMVIF